MTPEEVLDKTTEVVAAIVDDALEARGETPMFRTEAALRDQLTITPSEWSWKATGKVIPNAPALREGDRVRVDGAYGVVGTITVKDGGAILAVKITDGYLVKLAPRAQATLADIEAAPVVVDAKAVLDEHIATCVECIVDDGRLLAPCENYIVLADQFGISEAWPERA